MRPNRSQLAPLAEPSRLWTAPSYRQHRLPPTGSVNSSHSPQAVPQEMRNSSLQRKLGNGVCGLIRPQEENSTTLAEKRSAPEGNAPWAMESSKGVTLCACAAGDERVQPGRGTVAKYPGCCSLLAIRRFGAFPSHGFPRLLEEELLLPASQTARRRRLPRNVGAVGGNGGRLRLRYWGRS